MDAPAAAAAGQAITDRLAAIDDVTNVVSYWSIGRQAPLRSVTGNRALVVGRIVGTQDEVRHRVEELAPRFEGTADGPMSRSPGTPRSSARSATRSRPTSPGRDDRPAHHPAPAAVHVPGGGRGRAAPGHRCPVGGQHLPGAAHHQQRHRGVGLRPQPHHRHGARPRHRLLAVRGQPVPGGAGPRPAPGGARRTVRTAGRTVAFSAGTVAASLLALLVFPIAFLRSFAYAGVAVAALAGVFSVVVLPAMLAALGPRVNALAAGRRRPRARAEEHGGWYRVAIRVMDRPVGITTAVIAVLLVLGAPVPGHRSGSPRRPRAAPRGSGPSGGRRHPGRVRLQRGRRDLRRGRRRR